MIHGGLDIVLQLLEGKLRRVHADDDQTLSHVFFIPGLEIGNGALAIDTAVVPEIEEDDVFADISA